MTMLLERAALSDTIPALRMELTGLLLATAIVLYGTALTQEATLAREGADTAVGAVTAGVRTPGEFRREVAGAIAMLLAGFYGLHGLRRIRRLEGDGVLLPAVLVLCGLGLMAMITVQDPGADTLLAPPFASGVLLGCAVAAAAMTVNVECFRAFTYVPLLGAIVLSVLLIVFGGGPGRSDVKVNLWGGQPVEVIRLLEILFLAGYFGSRWEYLRGLRDPHVGRTALFARVHVPHLEYLLPLVLCMAATLAFYVAQQDLGPALIMACVFLGVYAVACRRIVLVAAAMTLLCGAFWAGYAAGFPPIVARRVAIWLSPWASGVRGGDQVAQGLWALASGGTWGRGPGLGDPQYVVTAHTDFVLAALGEELGFVGVATVLGLSATVAWRAFRIAERASADYSRFLALGIGLAFVLQLLLIAGGILGVLPLSGVVTPFISYGKSAMTMNLLALGLLLGIASRGGRPVLAFHRPIRALAAVVTTCGLVLAGRAWQVQVLAADETMARPSLVVLADGTQRFADNPRLVGAARDLMPRGTIVDRHGIPLALSGSSAVAQFGPVFAKLGIDLAAVCDVAAIRCYPFGPRAYHVLGDVRTEHGWTATNTSFIERDEGQQLRGFDDRATRVTVPGIDGGPPVTLTRRDYSELIPLVRHRYQPRHEDVQRLTSRPRDVALALDARLQAGVADLLKATLIERGLARGAAIVVDVTTRDVLASVSYPWPEPDRPPEHDTLDRARYGLYPPGSTFKLVTAMAALRRDARAVERPLFCERLGDGRVGRRIRGWPDPVRDDRSHHAPHGGLTLEFALAVSCNAYFAQLAVSVGSDALQATAGDFGIALSTVGTPGRARATLPYAGFGQGDVVTTPARFAQVVTTVAAGGLFAANHWVRTTGAAPDRARRIIPRTAADAIGRAMRLAVTSGTARTLASNKTPIAGKTGTAEVDGQRAHSWFAGFAPYQTNGRRIAFVVLVENGGYGAGPAAAVAGALVDLARQLRIIR